MDQLPGLLLLALPLLLLWMVFSRARRQQRMLAVAQASVRPGLWVITTSGLYGQVVAAGDEPTVLLEVAPGVHLRWARGAIAEVFEEDPASRVAVSSVVDLTTDDAHGTSISAPKVIDDQDDSHPDDRDDRTHN